MELGLLHLHSVLRWIILLLLIITLYHAFARKEALKSSSLWLMIAAHTMFVVGVYQLIAGRFGITKGIPEGVSLMKNDFYRFYWIEHPLLMLLAIGTITAARRKAKALEYKKVGWMLLVALLFILAAIPWPFRTGGIGRALFPGM